MQMRAETALLKREIEAKLAERIPAALSPRAQQAPRLHPIGNTQLDSLLGGGLPLGSVCELTGPEGSGRSSIALSLLAIASKEGACAWVDVSNAFSARSAAAAGVDLSNLLWVRFAEPLQTDPNPSRLSTTAPLHAGNGGGQREPIQQNRAGLHPRGETKGLAPALDQVLRQKEERRNRKREGTPGYPNQPLGLEAASQDQIEWERFNLRRVDETDPLRQSDRHAAEAARQRAAVQLPVPVMRKREAKPWDRLNRALRAADQVLQSGGFRLVVFDLASCSPQEVLRIPSATWFRFRKAAQESDAILLLLTKEPCARSSAACVLECSFDEPPQIQGVLASAIRRAEVARQRTGPALGKKAPGQATRWQATPASMRTVGK
jgi:recombination protein RecA